MVLFACSHVSNAADSGAAAEEVALALESTFGTKPLRAVLVYCSVDHDQAAVLRMLRNRFDPDTRLLGCSIQGVVGTGRVQEGPHLLGVMGLGGDSLEAAAAFATFIEVDTRSKGRLLGQKLRAAVKGEPKVAIVAWDSICGVDIEELVHGIAESLDCPIVGGGAGQPFGKSAHTYQYFNDQVLEHAAVVLVLSGSLHAYVGVCHGTSPTGTPMTVTRAEGNMLLELDGVPAITVWRRLTGASHGDLNDQNYGSHGAVGVKRPLEHQGDPLAPEYYVRAAFAFDEQRGGVIMQAAIPQGTSIMLHRRMVAKVIEGTQAMGQQLARAIGSRQPWAVLGFECGARTEPFLGEEGTLEENLALQRDVAPDAPWLGMMAWGEVAPVGKVPMFHNYTYPLLVLTND